MILNMIVAPYVDVLNEQPLIGCCHCCDWGDMQRYPTVKKQGFIPCARLFRLAFS